MDFDSHIFDPQDRLCFDFQKKKLSPDAAILLVSFTKAFFGRILLRVNYRESDIPYFVLLYRLFSCLVSRNVFYVVSALQSIVCLYVLLIRNRRRLSFSLKSRSLRTSGTIIIITYLLTIQNNFFTIC